VKDALAAVLAGKKARLGMQKRVSSCGGRPGGRVAEDAWKVP
jgi:hypothetical protein